MTGLYCIVLSSGLKAIIQYSLLNASIVCAGLVMMTYILINTGRRIFKNLYVDNRSAKTGKIDRIIDPTNIKLS